MSILREKIDVFLKDHENKAVNYKQLNEYLIKIGIVVNKTSIYRYLNKLVANNELVKVQDSYILRKKASCNEHIHLQCDSCGKIVHLDCDFNNLLVSHLKNNHGFNIDFDKTVIHGICNACKKKYYN